MAKGIEYNDRFPLSRIFLWLENPRHEAQESEAQAIAALCSKQDILPLARDIAEHGLNPLERWALLSAKRRGNAPPSYYAAEGNRRLCALKLLHDPELAPPELRKHFAKIAEDFDPPSSVPVAIFEDKERAKHWLERIHNGEQGGVGRKGWNADAKQRFYGGSKNRTAQALLDYAETEGMLSSEERAGKLTTVQRFVGNNTFREALGLDTSVPDDFGRTRPKGEFDKLTRIFIRDLVGKTKVTSRMNKQQIVQYARALAEHATTKRVEPEPLSPAEAKGKKSKSKRKPVRPEKARHIEFDHDIQRGLEELKSEKLRSLYYSICSIELEPHAPLIAVGVWSFVETVTACAGRNEGTNFESFLSNQKLRDYGIKDDMATLRAVMGRIREYGNTTKHHPISATFNGDQLNNDMRAFKQVLVKCIEDAVSRKK